MGIKGYGIYTKNFKKNFGKKMENLKRIRVIVDPREHKVRKRVYRLKMYTK